MLDVAFRAAQREVARCKSEHGDACRVGCWQPVNQEEQFAREYVMDESGTSQGLSGTAEGFSSAFAKSVDQSHRDALLQLKPGAYPASKEILVQPSTGLHKPFGEVLIALKLQDRALALFGLTRQDLIADQSRPVPMHLIEQHGELVFKLQRLVHRCFGVELEDCEDAN